MSFVGLPLLVQQLSLGGFGGLPAGPSGAVPKHGAPPPNFGSIAGSDPAPPAGALEASSEAIGEKALPIGAPSMQRAETNFLPAHPAVLDAADSSTDIHACPATRPMKQQ